MNLFDCGTWKNPPQSPFVIKGGLELAIPPFPRCSQGIGFFYPLFIFFHGWSVGYSREHMNVQYAGRLTPRKLFFFPRGTVGFAAGDICCQCHRQWTAQRLHKFGRCPMRVQICQEKQHGAPVFCTARPCARQAAPAWCRFRAAQEPFGALLLYAECPQFSSSANDQLPVSRLMSFCFQRRKKKIVVFLLLLLLLKQEIYFYIKIGLICIELQYFYTFLKKMS